MQKQHYSITINAPKEKVWHTMLDLETYKEWTQPMGGAGYKGDWNKGSKISFVGPDPETGKEGGMVGRIAENKQYEFLSIEYTAIMMNGIEDTTSDMAKQWLPASETYTFTEKDGVTELTVDVDVADAQVDEFKDMWIKGLQKLKEVAER